MSDEKPENKPEIGTDAWWQQVQEQRRQASLSAAQCLKDACPTLAGSGITSVVWRYDGYGDSGEITGAEIKGNDKAPQNLEALKTLCKLSDQDGQHALNYDNLENAVWQLLPAGFENNEGGFGEVALDVVNGGVQVRHNYRVEATEYEEKNY